MRATKPVQTSANASTGLFDGLEREMWFLDRMQQLGAAGISDLFAGVTDEATRRERIWDAVLSNGLRTVIIGARNGKSETFEACYTRLFGGPLDSNTARRGR